MEKRFIEHDTTLIDELLAQQKSLTAVERFAKIHDGDALPAQARYYRDLIPMRAPTTSEQYAFEVDLDQCSGCKACVTACHALNGLDEDETWRSVGLLHGVKDGAAFQRTVTTACHHCAEPGCLEGCPTLAYEKNPITGIVKHLDDQCIGCQYCVMKCPYDVPKYSDARGIVRKCDMCSSRLSAGEAPACVQACPNEAIRITLVDRAEVSREFAAATANTFLPDSPAPNYTQPTTKYHSAEPLQNLNLRGADHAKTSPAPAHPPLVLFLVLTQMSVGGFAMLPFSAHPGALAMVSLIAGLLGLGASVLHLGRPLQAWRSFLGLRRSWLSREIVVFGFFAPLAMACAASFWLPGSNLLRLQQLLAATVSLSGMSGVLCSVMVYHDTRRKFWRWPRATIQFFGTTLLLGAATLLATGLSRIAIDAIGAASIVKLALDFWNVRVGRGVSGELSRSAQLLSGPLRPLFALRILTLALGGIIFPMAAPQLTLAILGLCLCSELLDRHLFFVAVGPDKMPGVPG